MRLPQLIEATKGVDGVLHLAALMSLTMDRDPWTGLDVNIRGTQNTIEACCVTGVKKLVFASSSAVYGYGPGMSGDLVETTPFTHVGAPPAAIIYGATKIIGEQLCRDALRQARARLRGGALFHRLRRAPALPRDQRALHHRDARPRAPGPAPARDRRRLRHQAFRACQRCRRAPTPRRLLPMPPTLPSISRDPSPPPRWRSSASSPSLRARTWSPSTSSPRRARCSLTSGGAWRMDHALAERIIGWRPQVDMREGIGRLLAWRDASGKT